MKSFEEQLSSEYMSILISFLWNQDETGLQRGYELGRKAIESRQGLLPIAEAHNQNLKTIIEEASPESAKMVTQAGAILAATLAPFEMTHRGYQESVSRLQSLNQELEAYSYSVSHDLRAPLRSIIGFIQILQEDHSRDMNESARALLQRVSIAARRMESIITGLLSLSHVDREKLKKEPVDLAKLFREILEDLQLTEKGRKVQAKVSGPAVVIGDKKLLSALMTNLVSNAWKFTAKRAEAVIEFGQIQLSGQLVYFVKDNGAGFDMHQSSGLFQAFQRLHPNSEFEGTGIGLATVRRIVERHGGKVWAESKADQGAAFYFTLPSS